MNKAAEVGGKNNLSHTVKNYAGTVVQHAGQAVVEGAKLFQDRIVSRTKSLSLTKFVIPMPIFSSFCQGWIYFQGAG